MSSEPMMVTTHTLAALCGVSVRRIQQLGDDGVIRSEARGQWNATACVPAFIAHRVALAEAAAAKRTGGANERHVAAKAREVELRTARSEHTLIETAEALAAIDEVVGTAKAGFSALPARITRDVELRERIEAEVDAIWDRLAAQNARRAAELRQHGGVTTPAEADEPAAEPAPVAPTKGTRRAAR